MSDEHELFTASVVDNSAPMSNRWNHLDPTQKQEHMSITSSNWVLADCSPGRVSGRRALGGYGIHIPIKFDTKPWNQKDPAPVVTLGHAHLTMTQPMNIFVDFAIPDSACGVHISQYPSTPHITYNVILNQAALQEVEMARNGAGVEMTLRLTCTIDDGQQLLFAQESVSVPLNQSDWLRILNECGFGKSLTFEVPVITEAELDTSLVTDDLRAAQRHLSLGHYQEVVAACRRAIEALNNLLGQTDALKTARSVRGEDRKSLTLGERELLIRGAVLDFCHLAHHSNQVQGRPFDRFDATMILATTASLAKSALARHQIQGIS